MTPRELVDSALTRPLRFAPGSRYEYSNTNTVLLGMVVEKVSGLSLGQFLQDNMFGPVGLTRTTYPTDGWLPGPYGHGYNKAPDGAILDAALWNPSWADAAGKIVSNVYDMRTWTRTLGAGALLRPETHAERIGNGSSVLPGVDYSFAIFNVHGWRGHNGDIPGYATVAVYLPERDAVLVVSSTPMYLNHIRPVRSRMSPLNSRRRTMSTNSAHNRHRCSRGPATDRFNG